jgi:hypothetical protein
MSPEQITLPESVDARSDLYSLGVVFYELLTGEVPFRGVVRMTLLQVVHEEPVAPRRFNDRIHKDLETICLKAMSKLPASRFSSAQEMVAELDRWLAGKPIRSRPVTRLERGWRWCKRNPVVAILCGMVASLLVSLAAVSTYSAIRLSASERLIRENAMAAVKQRDAALDTLGKLVFELQQKFDHDEIDLDLLQENSLRIALNGLKQIRETALTGAVPDLHTAEALRRLGEILLRLEKDEEAVECLTDSERILRSNLQREPANRQALQSLVETLWLLDEADSLREDDQGSNRLNQATVAARKLIAVDPSTNSMLVLANSLLYEGRFEFQFADHARSRELLDESRTLFGQHLSGESDDSISAQTAWIECNDLISQVLLEQKQLEMAKDLLAESVERANAFITKRPDNFPLLTRRLSMMDRLARLYSELGENGQAAVVKGKLSQLTKSLANAASNDTENFFDVVDMYGELADENLTDGDIERAESFQRQQLKIIEARLVRLPGDDQGRLELARCWSDLATLSVLQDHSVESIEAEFHNSLEQFRSLTTNRSFDTTDWQYFLETLIEAIEFSIEHQRQGYQSLVDETRKYLQQLRETIPADEQAWLAELEVKLRSILETAPLNVDR